MTLASINVNFQFVVAQGHTAAEMELLFLETLAKVAQHAPSIVEWDLLPGTQTKVDPFNQAPVVQFSRPLALR